MISEIPFCEQEDAADQLDLIKGLTPEDELLVRRFLVNGYVILDLKIPETTLTALKADMDAVAAKQDRTLQAQGYHYSDSPRLFELWRTSQEALNLARHPVVEHLLRILYRATPRPFQTINFLKGTNQPLHSDTLHFHCDPPLWLAVCWVALEDIGPKQGPLEYVPGSHKYPVYDFTDIGLPVPKYGEQFEAYHHYEAFIQALYQSRGGYKVAGFLPKGHAIVWAANLLHGGMPIEDPTLTRYSQVTHYYFEGCRHYYCPMFSPKGAFAIKDLTTKNIRHHVIS